MLDTDRKGFAFRALFDVFALYSRHLLINGADIAQQLLALFRHRDAGASPVKDPKPHFFLHRLDGMGQAGLGDIELFCSLADGRALGHRQQISDFFQRHIDSLSMRR